MTTTGHTRPTLATTPRTGRLFYGGVALVAIVLAALAFTPSLVYQGGRRGALTPLVVAHAAFMTAWLALFAAQAFLASTGRLGLHRRMGPTAVLIAAGVVSTGVASTVAMVQRGHDLSGDLSRLSARASDQAVFQFGGVLIFGVLVGTALLLHHRPETHKRLMTIAVIQTLMAAPLAHIVGHFGLPGVILPAWGIAIVLVLVAYDRHTRGRVHPASLWGGLGVAAVNNVQAVVIGPSEAWQRFLAWLAG